MTVLSSLLLDGSGTAGVTTAGVQIHWLHMCGEFTTTRSYTLEHTWGEGLRA